MLRVSANAGLAPSTNYSPMPLTAQPTTTTTLGTFHSTPSTLNTMHCPGPHDATIYPALETIVPSYSLTTQSALCGVPTTSIAIPSSSSLIMTHIESNPSLSTWFKATFITVPRLNLRHRWKLHNFFVTFLLFSHSWIQTLFFYGCSKSAFSRPCHLHYKFIFSHFGFRVSFFFLFFAEKVLAFESVCFHTSSKASNVLNRISAFFGLKIYATFCA